MRRSARRRRPRTAFRRSRIKRRDKSPGKIVASMGSGTIITVFGSSRPRAGESDYEEARRLGGELARRGFQVCSGGYAGIMEAVSRGAKEAGGRTIAITSTFFRTRASDWVDEEHAASTWQERLFELI